MRGSFRKRTENTVGAICTIILDSYTVYIVMWHSFRTIHNTTDMWFVRDSNQRVLRTMPWQAPKHLDKQNVAIVTSVQTVYRLILLNRTVNVDTVRTHMYGGDIAPTLQGGTTMALDQTGVQGTRSLLSNAIIIYDQGIV